MQLIPPSTQNFWNIYLYVVKRGKIFAHQVRKSVQETQVRMYTKIIALQKENKQQRKK